MLTLQTNPLYLSVPEEDWSGIVVRIFTDDVSMKAVSVKPDEEYYRRRSLLIIKEQETCLSRVYFTRYPPHAG